MTCVIYAIDEPFLPNDVHGNEVLSSNINIVPVIFIRFRAGNHRRNYQNNYQGSDGLLNPFRFMEHVVVCFVTNKTYMTNCAKLRGSMTPPHSKTVLNPESERATLIIGPEDDVPYSRYPT
ncbi:LOW QUALITY PROTEIN: hypothetical protein MAR_008003 [Mya arenaria]|uniref:Uncharacterized protein n=1 Tax=Mya arenaria TaxID=6604 RepID=A0ABY7DUQ8_MYAAR|nr:LOW QUALITY PROTEIN: hypothetical protein MAR_008003 [Mya arenaria]